MHISHSVRPMMLMAGLLSAVLAPGMAQTGGTPAAPAVATPIKHVVVTFQENVSFDHYFATYPNALNSDANEPVFLAGSRTPGVNGQGGPPAEHRPESAALVPNPQPKELWAKPNRRFDFPRLRMAKCIAQRFTCDARYLIAEDRMHFADRALHFHVEARSAISHHFFRRFPQRRDEVVVGRAFETIRAVHAGQKLSISRGRRGYVIPTAKAFLPYDETITSQGFARR